MAGPGAPGGRRGWARGRAWAIIERELRRFRRSPTLIVVSLVFPVAQLLVLGYAFGGNVKHLKLGIVSSADAQGSGAPVVPVRPPLDSLRREMAIPSHDDVRGRIDSTGYALHAAQMAAAFERSALPPAPDSLGPAPAPGVAALR